MIHIEIIESPDLNIVSNFEFFQNQLYIGRNSGDFWINDPGLLEAHLMLEVIEDQLYVHPQKNVSFYLINGKRAGTIRKVKKDDTITIGKTIFKVLQFELTVEKSKKVILDEKLKKLVDDNSIRLGVIESLAKRMG